MITGRAAGVLAVWLAMSMTGVGGCAGDGAPRKDATASPTTDVFGRPVGSDGKPVVAGEGSEAASSAWSIVLGAFSPDREQETGQPYEAAAHTALFRAHAMGGLNTAHLEKRGNGLVLLYGSYESPTGGDAQRDLAYVRSLEIGGVRAYESAFISAPGSSAGSMPDYDLATVKSRRGTSKPLYSLQIAVYGRPDNSEATKEDLVQFRAAAEKAVAGLRQDGEQAYYYHGPNRSAVTIGVFTEQEAGMGGRVRMESAALALAKQKYPNNLMNGEAVRERLPGRAGIAATDFRLQSSRLVEVPE